MAGHTGKRMLIAALLTGSLLALVLWWANSVDTTPAVASSPQDCLQRFREAILRDDQLQVQAILAEPLRSRQTELISEHQSRLTDSLSWIIVSAQEQENTAHVLVHEVHRNGWIYPVQYELARVGSQWQISRIICRQPEKSPITPGTHIRETLASSPETASSDQLEDAVPDKEGSP